jgi:hypothetical protein
VSKATVKAQVGYFAYAEDAKSRAAGLSTLEWSVILPPQVTDPKKPRPIEIRTEDVLTHGLRHVAFLVRYSQDESDSPSLVA